MLQTYLHTAAHLSFIAYYYLKCGHFLHEVKDPDTQILCIGDIC